MSNNLNPLPITSAAFLYMLVAFSSRASARRANYLFVDFDFKSFTEKQVG